MPGGGIGWPDPAAPRRVAKNGMSPDMPSAGIQKKTKLKPTSGALRLQKKHKITQAQAPLLELDPDLGGIPKMLMLTTGAVGFGFKFLETPRPWSSALTRVLSWKLLPRKAFGKPWEALSVMLAFALGMGFGGAAFI